MEDRVSIHFSVEDGIIEVEQKKGPLISRKEISGPASKLLPEKRLYQGRRTARPVFRVSAIEYPRCQADQGVRQRGRMVPPPPCGSVAV